MPALTYTNTQRHITFYKIKHRLKPIHVAESHAEIIQDQTSVKGWSFHCVGFTVTVPVMVAMWLAVLG